MSVYKGGFDNGVVMREVPVSTNTTGRVYWVDNSTSTKPTGVAVGADTKKGSYNHPFATIDYAIGQCEPGRGDVINVKAGHAETLATASAITVDVAGITIVGHGEGAAKPTLTYSATASTCVISANNVTIKNIRVTPSVDSVVTAFSVSGADCTLDIETKDASSSVEFITAVTTTAAADRIKINATHYGFTAGDAGTFYIKLVGNDQAKVNVDYYGKATTAVVNFATTACLGVEVTGTIHNGDSTTSNKLVVDSQGSSKWIADIYDSMVGDRVVGGSGSAFRPVGSGVSSPGTYVPGLGYKVTKTEDVNTATSDDLFTVTGKVLITMWECEVTNALDAAVTDYKISMTTLNADLVAAGNIASSIVGHMFMLNSDAGDTSLSSSTYAVSVSGSADTNGKGLAMRVVGKAGGTDTLKAVRTAGAAGDAIVHTLFYLPLEASASVVAAA